MARQEGILKLVGSIGNLSFYDSKYGPIARRKGGPDANKIKHGKTFERVREHNREFGACGKAGGLMRRALMPMLREAPDTTMVSRLIKLLFAIKNLDAVSARGSRSVGNGLSTPEGKALLEGFDFNATAPLKTILKKAYQVSAGIESLSIPGFKPKQDLKVPTGASHVRLRYLVLELDFDSDKLRLSKSTDLMLPVNNVSVPVHLNSGASAPGQHRLAGVLQICFYQDINGELYPLKEHGHHAMGIVAVI